MIVQLPFLGKIYHIDNTFSCVAIVCLVLLAGFGIKAFWNDSAGNFRSGYLRVMVSLAGLLALYLGTTEAAQRSTRAFLQVGNHIPKSGFFWIYAALLVMALVALPWIGRSAPKEKRTRMWQALALGSIFVILHWRHGMHLETRFDAYVMNPKPRVTLIATLRPRSACRTLPVPSHRAAPDWIITWPPDMEAPSTSR